MPEVWAIESASFSNPWRKTAFIGEIHNPPISHPYVIVHSSEKRVIGYIIYWLLQEEVQISNIAIHPDYRRMGIGETVLRQVMAKLKGEKVRFIFLEVRPSNTIAIDLYKKLGFDIVGIRKDYYRNPEEHAIVMGKTLIQ